MDVRDFRWMLILGIFNMADKTISVGYLFKNL